jgi:hypothetical protein
VFEHLQRDTGVPCREVKVEDTKRSHKFHRVNVIAAVGKVLTAEYLKKHAQGGRKPKRSLKELLILTLKQ